MNLAHVCVVIVGLQVSGVVLTGVFRRRYAVEEFTALASLTLWPILVAWGLLASAWNRTGLFVYVRRLSLYQAVDSGEMVTVNSRIYKGNWRKASWVFVRLGSDRGITFGREHDHA